MIEVSTPFKPAARQSFTLRRDDGEETFTVEGPPELYAGEIEDMADAILDGRPTRISLADSQANAAALATLVESARLGRPVPLR